MSGLAQHLAHRRCPITVCCKISDHVTPLLKALEWVNIIYHSEWKPNSDFQGPAPIPLNWRLSSSACSPSLTPGLLDIAHTCWASPCLRTLALAMPSSETFFSPWIISLFRSLLTSCSLRKAFTASQFEMWNFPFCVHSVTLTPTFSFFSFLLY